MTRKESDGNKIHRLGELFIDELRMKSAPAAGLAWDFISGKDFDKNILPTSDEKPRMNKYTGKMAHKMTLGEYAMKHLTPIPVQEAQRDEGEDVLGGVISGITGIKVGSKDKKETKK
jgi:hypothetical protein